MPRHQSNYHPPYQPHIPTAKRHRSRPFHTPTRPLPRNRQPATTTALITKPHNTDPPITITSQNKVDTPHPPIRETPWPPKPSLQQLGQRMLTHAPLIILELYGGTATGLEALLKAGHHIKTYAWADTDPDANISLQHRITQMRER